MPNASDPMNIPLRCTICPERSDFSDLSHLLTHVDSKTHIKLVNNVRTMAEVDPQADQQFTQYQQWYDKYNLGQLLRERSAQKAKKKKVANGGNNSVNINPARRGAGASRKSSHTSSVPLTKRRGTRQGSALDPQLHRSRSNFPSYPPMSNNPFHPTNTLRRPFPMPTQSWSNSPGSRYDSPTMKQESVSSDELWDENDWNTMRMPNDYYSYPSVHNRHSHSNASLLGEVDGYEPGETIADPTKMKGIYWPGMAQFDSATPENQRKRNQKKSKSVLKKLEATSEQIEPTEMVFDAAGTLRRERVITGEVESGDDLIEGESSPEPQPYESKRRQRRMRIALSERNVNNGRRIRKRQPPPSLPSFGSSNGPYFKKPDVDDDDDLTYRKRPRNRRGFSIHKDDSGPEITFDQPAPLNYLTSGLGHSFNSSGYGGTMHSTQAHQPNNVITRPHQRQSSWGFLNNNSFRPMHPSGLPSAQNMATFGQFISNSVAEQSSFVHAAMGRNNPMTSGYHMMGTLGQQYSAPLLPSRSTTQNTGMTSNGITNACAPFHFDENVLDTMFGFDNETMNLNEQPFFGLPTNEAPTTNPLLFGNGRADVEDDEGTISASEE